MPVILLGSSLAVSAAKPDLTDPPPGVFLDQYYSLYLGKTKCGWAWYQLERKNDDVITRNKINIKMGREDLTIEVAVISETRETVTGKPLTFQAEQNLAGSKTVYRGEFKKPLVIMSVTQSGQTAKHEFPAPADTTMAWGDYLQTLKYLNQPGKTFTTHSFDPQMGPGKIGVTTINIVGPATAQIAGKTITGTKVVAQSDMLGPYPITTYIDARGCMAATDMQVGILKLQLVAASKKEAQADIRREEVFTNSFVKLSRPLITMTSKKFLALKITAIGAEPLPAIPQTTMQRIARQQPKSVVLHIAVPGQKRYPSTQPKPTAVNLASSAYTRTDDPVLIKLANQAAGRATDPHEVAARLCRFVGTHITKKTLSRAFDTAGEAARSKSGDCTEHAVLMAALARIKKIPAQVVAGLVYTDANGPYGSFGYHMWTEVWINGRWLDMDPTFGEVEPDPTHIALATQDLGDENFTRQAIGLVKFIGQIKIEQVEK